MFSNTSVILSYKRFWSHHIQAICRRARKVLGIIYRKFASNSTHSSVILQLNTSLVQPHLEFAAQVWNPHLAKDIHCIEMVQTFTLRICAKKLVSPMKLFWIYSRFHHNRTGGYFYQWALFKNKPIYVIVYTAISFVMFTKS